MQGETQRDHDAAFPDLTEAEIASLGNWTHARNALRSSLFSTGAWSAVMALALFVGAFAGFAGTPSLHRSDILPIVLSLTGGGLLAWFSFRVFVSPTPALLRVASFLVIVAAVAVGLGFALLKWVLRMNIHGAWMMMPVLPGIAAFHLWKVYRPIAEIFREKPDSKTESRLGIVEGRLVLEQSATTDPSRVVRLKASGVTWVAFLYRDVLVARSFGDLFRTTMVLAPPSRVSVSANPIRKGDKYQTHLTIGDFSLEGVLGKQDYETLTEWMQNQGVQATR